MIELVCDACGKHIGWITDGGPRGFVECDDCHEEEEND